MKGSVIWNLQRYSSLVVLSYVVYVMIFILSFQMRFLTSIVCVFILIHAFIGLWTVGTDYLTKRTLGFLSNPLSAMADMLRKAYLFLFVVLGLMYLTVILYIIWT